MKKLILLLLFLIIPLVSAITVVDVNYSSIPSNISLWVNTSSNFTSVVVNDSFIYVEDYLAVHPIYNIDTFAVAVVKSDGLVNYTFNVNNSWFIINDLTSSLFSSENFSVSSSAIRVPESSVFYASYNAGSSLFSFSSMWVELELPNGSFVNHSMVSSSGSIYKFVFDSNSFTSTIYGDYFFRSVFVNDSANLLNSTSVNLNVSVYRDNTEVPANSGSGPLAVTGGTVSNPVMPVNDTESSFFDSLKSSFNQVMPFENGFSSNWLPVFFFDKDGVVVRGIYIIRVALMFSLLLAFLFWRKSVVVKNERKKAFFSSLLGKR